LSCLSRNRSSTRTFREIPGLAVVVKNSVLEGRRGEIGYRQKLAVKGRSKPRAHGLVAGVCDAMGMPKNCRIGGPRGPSTADGFEVAPPEVGPKIGSDRGRLGACLLRVVKG